MFTNASRKVVTKRITKRITKRMVVKTVIVKQNFKFYIYADDENKAYDKAVINIKEGVGV